MSIIPTTYAEWEHCITVTCGVPLTPEYVAERIAALENHQDVHTQKYIEQWGKEQHARSLAWFKEAQAKLSK
ncbi:MAG: hypothetical protein AAF213_08225 [Pseudomonadota bacterium]